MRVCISSRVRHLFSSHLLESGLQRAQGVPLRGHARPLRKADHLGLQRAQNHPTCLQEILNSICFPCIGFSRSLSTTIERIQSQTVTIFSGYKTDPSS